MDTGLNVKRSEPLAAAVLDVSMLVGSSLPCAALVLAGLADGRLACLPL
jgi:hypothetical protein